CNGCAEPLRLLRNGCAEPWRLLLDGIGRIVRRIGGDGDGAKARAVRDWRLRRASRTGWNRVVIGGLRRPGPTPTECADLLLHLLQLRRHGPDLRLEGVEASGIGGGEGGGDPHRRAAACDGRRRRPFGKRFKRADDDLYVDELLLELFNPLAQA